MSNVSKFNILLENTKTDSKFFDLKFDGKLLPKT